MALNELITQYPKESLILIAILITLITTIVNKKFSDQRRMKELKDIQKACKINLKNAKGNQDELGKINKQMMECSLELMKHSFKPMFITMIPFLFLFWWIRSVYINILPGWIWWYLGTAIISSILFRKILKVA
ncbi:MAG TPA: EMC3/TMCO1 family protein [Candidatus Nanoarchaeia archaeon]|nr:EMC3/TMCO1 family protein [Candidatus Nanoarchaeia archaeon]